MILEEQEAIEFLSDFYGGQHHFPSKLQSFGPGWKMVHYADLSTYDFSGLTRLVVMAHDRCIRVSIMPAGRFIAIILHKRKREGNMFERHPTLEEQIDKIRDEKRR